MRRKPADETTYEVPLQKKRSTTTSLAISQPFSLRRTHISEQSSGQSKEHAQMPSVTLRGRVAQIGLGRQADPSPVISKARTCHLFRGK